MRFLVNIIIKVIVHDDALPFKDHAKIRVKRRSLKHDIILNF